MVPRILPDIPASVLKLYFTPPQLELFQTSETVMWAKSQVLLCSDVRLVQAVDDGVFEIPKLGVIFRMQTLFRNEFS